MLERGCIVFSLLCVEVEKNNASHNSAILSCIICHLKEYNQLWHVCFDRSTTALRCDFMRQTEEILSSEALQGHHSGTYLLSVKHTRAVEGVTNLRRHIISWSASNNNSYGEQSCSDLCDCGSRCRYEIHSIARQKFLNLNLSCQLIPTLFKYTCIFF